MAKRFEGNYNHLQYIVKITFQSLSSEKDAARLEEFFKVNHLAVWFTFSR